MEVKLKGFGRLRRILHLMPTRTGSFRRLFRRGVLILLVCLVVIAFAAPITQALSQPYLWLDGPLQVLANSSHDYRGMLRTREGGVQSAEVTILVDGVTAAGATTDQSGSFEASIFFEKSGTVSIQAIAEEGMVKSAVLPVHAQSHSAARVTVGKDHSCASMSDRSIRCWGNNGSGQLGDGTVAWSRSIPVSVAGPTDAVELSAGGNHTCALESGASIKCWGANGWGQLGDGTTTTRPTPVTVELSDAVSISAGFDHSCAVLSSGQVSCWGRNAYGQLGDGTTTDRSLPLTVSGLSDAVAVSAGGNHTCALLNDKTVHCWGRNQWGQLGDGSTADSLAPRSVANLAGVARISAGFAHTCALLSDGTGRCWGYNGGGALGSGGGLYHPIPQTVIGLSDAIEISAGFFHTCALGSGGTGTCWGKTPIGTVEQISAIDAGENLTCAIFTSGLARCWGPSELLGNGLVMANPVPANVLKLTAATSISSGDYHTCTLVPDASARCWGSNGAGQLGEMSYEDQFSPVAPPSMVNLNAIDAGSITCSVRTNGAVRCWGYRNFLYLNPNLLLPATDVTVGGYHQCAILIGGVAQCWGVNSYGQLGNGNTTSTSEPQVVKGLIGATSISVGRDHTCAVLADSTARCWGFNRFGQLGAGITATPLGVPVPVPVAGLAGIRQISAGADHTCAVLEIGAVYCWGSNEWGQLGTGSTFSRNSAYGDVGPNLAYNVSPVPVVMNAREVSAGGFHTCAVVEDGTVQCWGANFLGQLGNGTTSTWSLTPVTVLSVSDAVAVSVGAYHSCALLKDGSARCWGYDIYGQLGNAPAEVSFVD